MGGGLGFSSNGTKFGIPYYKKFLDKRCEIRKNCWLGNDYISEEVGAARALSVLCIVVFEVR